jgi:hypothetical protein
MEALAVYTHNHPGIGYHAVGQLVVTYVGEPRVCHCDSARAEAR